MNLNGVQQNKKKIYRWKFLFLFLFIRKFSFFILRMLYNLVNSLHWTTLVKKLESLYKMRDRQIQEDASSTKLDGMKDATNDSLNT